MAISLDLSGIGSSITNIASSISSLVGGAPASAAPSRPDTTLKLGAFVFSEFEIPPKITLGGSQAIALHKLPGGVRIVQNMGRDDAPVTWSALFSGANALARAHQLDKMRIAGQVIPFSFFDVLYNVVIRTFTFDVERHYRVPYTITLEVIVDQSDTPPKQSTSLTTAITGDNSLAQGLGNVIGDSGLSGMLGTMNSAISSVSDFAKASTSTINSVLGPVAAVTSTAMTLLASATNTIQNVTTVGGLFPGNSVAAQAAKLTSQANALTTSGPLMSLIAISNRMTSNLNLASGTGVTQKTVTVGGTTLYKVADQQYGDPSKWQLIASANGLTDPNITTITTLKIPPPQ